MAINLIDVENRRFEIADKPKSAASVAAAAQSTAIKAEKSVAEGNLLWRSQILDVCFVHSSTDQNQRKLDQMDYARIVDAAMGWMAGRADITFKFTTASGRICKDIKDGDIRVALTNDANWSEIGNAAITSPEYDRITMRLNRSDVASGIQGPIWHEFGHALGLIHEHQRPGLRGCTRFYRNMETRLREVGWDERTISRDIPELAHDVPGNETRARAPKSIMMYQLPEQGFSSRDCVDEVIGHRNAVQIDPADFEALWRAYPPGRRR